MNDVVPADERRHESDGERLWNESYYLDWFDPEGRGHRGQPDGPAAHHQHPVAGLHPGRGHGVDRHGQWFDQAGVGDGQALGQGHHAGRVHEDPVGHAAVVDDAVQAQVAALLDLAGPAPVAGAAGQGGADGDRRPVGGQARHLVAHRGGQVEAGHVEVRPADPGGRHRHQDALAGGLGCLHHGERSVDRPHRSHVVPPRSSECGLRWEPATTPTVRSGHVG